MSEPSLILYLIVSDRERRNITSRENDFKKMIKLSKKSGLACPVSHRPLSGHKKKQTKQ